MREGRALVGKQTPAPVSLTAFFPTPGVCRGCVEWPHDLVRTGPGGWEYNDLGSPSLLPRNVAAHDENIESTLIDG
jgi:hypothetical protein